MRQPANIERFQRFAKATEWPLGVLALLIIPSILLDDHAHGHRFHEIALWLNWIVWLAFCGELAVKAWLAPDRRYFLRHAWFDLVIVVLSPPFIGPEYLQGLRAVRLVRLSRLLRFVRALAVAGIALESARDVLAHRRLHYVVLATVVIVSLGAFGIYGVEHGLNPAIGSIGDAFWWAVVTATTVGYGDISRARLSSHALRNDSPASKRNRTKCFKPSLGIRKNRCDSCYRCGPPLQRVLRPAMYRRSLLFNLRSGGHRLGVLSTTARCRGRATTPVHQPPGQDLRGAAACEYHLTQASLKREETMTNITRRRLLKGAAAVATAGAFVTRAVFTPTKVLAQPKPGATADGVKALVYDVFGTCVDWRSGVARDAERILRPLGYQIDWLAFADAWRALYNPSMEEVRSGRQPFVKLDILHRRMLDQIRPKFGLEKLDNKVADDLNLAWHRLDTWPDTVPGLVRLKRKFMLAPCSNGNIALMVDIARRNNIPWDAILGSEIARDFKPKPAVYLMTAAALNLQPNEVMMVAAHSDDLRQAASNGLRTAHVARPGENGPGTGESAPRVPVDFAAKSMEDLASQLGV